MERKLTEEEVEMRAAIDAHQAQDKWEKQLALSAWIAYLIGFPLFIFNSDGPWEMAGGLIVGAALGTFVYTFFIVHRKTVKLAREAKKLVDAYMRKKALPFYHELLEKFDMTGVHIHLNDDGTITITDKRNEIKE